MLVTFKSKATGNLFMFEENAMQILDLFGKDTIQGIITVEEMPEAIRILEAEIARKKIEEAKEREEREKAEREEEERLRKEAEEAFFNDEEEEEEDPCEEKAPPPPPPERPVPFSARAFPFLQMLRTALKKEREIVWGV
ncbi:MAG: DUF1840 domain-containing protein [Oxalobacter formigenes]|nr:DUF1840 domain-containing protein [Oxalobacter formigenes]